MKNRMSTKQSAKVTSEIKAYWTGHLNSRKKELLAAMGGTEKEWQVMEAGLDQVKWLHFPIQHPSPSVEEMSEIAAQAFEKAPKESGEAPKESGEAPKESGEAPKESGEVPVLYQGHKGPGVGILKTDAPDRRDGDKDTVVAERRPRVSEKHPKSPIKLSDYGKLQNAIQDYKQTTNVPKKKKPSAEKLMGYHPAKKKSHPVQKAGRGGSEMKAAKK